MSDDWYKGDGIRAVDDEQKDEVLARLGELWKRHPQLRLMQLLGNVFRHGGTDPYYIEDFDAIGILEKAYAEWAARTDARRMPSKSELKRFQAVDEAAGEVGYQPKHGNA